MLTLGMLTIFLFVLVTPASATSSGLTWDRNPKVFEHGIALEVDGKTLYFKGPGSVDPPVIDVPGHTWIQIGRRGVIGLHYNVGPWLAPAGTPWWASGEPYGELLFVVRGIIAVPPEDLSEKAENKLKRQGYVHFHELVDANKVEYEGKVVYLKHIAIREFYFDGGPMAPLSNHQVYPGIDYMFMPNW